MLVRMSLANFTLPVLGVSKTLIWERPGAGGAGSGRSSWDGQHPRVEAADPKHGNHEIERGIAVERIEVTAVRTLTQIEPDEQRLLHLRGGPADVEQHPVGIGLIDRQSL